MTGRRSLFTLTCTLLLGGFAGAQSPVAHPYRATGIYNVGEKAGWTFSSRPGATSTKFTYRLKQNNQTILNSGDLDLASGITKIDATLNAPGMLYLELTPISGGQPFTYGAAVAPTKLKPSVPRPKDFDAFWKRKIAELHRVPENAVLTPGDGGRSDVDYATLRMDHVNGTHTYGQLAKPKKPGKYPAVLILQWASPPYPLQRAWVTDRAAEGWLALNIEPHDVLPTEGPAYYQGLPAALKNYQNIGMEDRERSYFVEMYLRDYRAVDYLTHCPDWDGKTLLVMGTSMGGQQTLAVSGLHPRVTHLIVEEPAGCDLNGNAAGRQEGYPFLPTNNPKVRETVRYIDAVSFASRIRAKSLVAMGFTDNVAPPAGIWTAFNLIRGPKEAAPMPEAPHNNTATAEQQRPYYNRSWAWMNALVHGGDIPAPEAVVPVERTDPNSRLAHRQLLEKARKGGIDLYFVGDSITRRWGTSDAQYRDFLANWRSNFFGWNAADFGWGGDSTANILWRLRNGELDGVDPKVISILAGTNDVGPSSENVADSAKVESTVAGIREIVAECRRRAPRARIVLTAIFPRRDNASPTITSINEQLATMADGKRIRFLNVNDRLSDEMTVDGLHPNLRGYQIWADGLRPILTEWLGTPARADHAPPPTGDPSAH